MDWAQSAHKGEFSEDGTAYIVGVQGDFIAASTIIRLKPPDSHWYSVGPSNEIGELYGLTIPSSSYIYSCGVNGKILKSSDAGDYWISQKTPTTQRLNSISFINKEIGFAVGDSGTILYTQNGGRFDTSKSGQLVPFGLQDKIITSLTGEDSYNYFPNNFNSIFAGTQEDGVFSKSITASFDSAWTPLGLEDKSITALTVQHWGVGPADGLRLYAAVIPQDNHTDSTIIFSREIRIPVDTNWSKSDSGIGNNVNRINTLNSCYYTGHTAPQPILAGTNFGIYTRLNNYWTQSDIKQLNIQPIINSIDIDSHWGSTLAWAAGNIDSTPMAFRSTDRGMSWKAITLTGYIGSSATSVAVNPRNTDSVYVSWNKHIFLTPDNGESWEDIFSSRGILINNVAVDPLHPENVFAGGWFFDDSHQTQIRVFFSIVQMEANIGIYQIPHDESLNEVTSIVVLQNPV